MKRLLGSTLAQARPTTALTLPLALMRASAVRLLLGDHRVDPAVALNAPRMHAVLSNLSGVFRELLSAADPHGDPSAGQSIALAMTLMPGSLMSSRFCFTISGLAFAMIDLSQ